MKGLSRVAYETPGEQSWISIAHYSVEDEGSYYMLAFEDKSPQALYPMISGQIINAVTGRALLPLELGLDISGELGGYYPSVSPTGEPAIPFIVAWQGTQGELRARYMDTGDSSLSPFDMVFTPEGAMGAAGRIKVSSDPTTGRSAIFWQESTGKLHDVYASFIMPGDTSGSVYHIMQVAGDELRDEINLDVSYNSKWPSFLVAYESTDYLTSYNILLTSVTDPDYPEITVEDPVYPFEDLSVEYPEILFNTSVSHTLNVFNDSPYERLRIMDIITTGPFSVAGENCTLETLAPSGEPCSVTVEFSPFSRGPMSGSLNIHSNDPNEPEAVLHLSGRSLAPAIEITDTSMPPDDLKLDLGRVRTGDVTEGTVTVRNIGDHVLSLGIVRYNSSPDFLIKEDNCSLQALMPSTHCTVIVGAAPGHEGPAAGGLWIVSDAPEHGEMLVELRAEGAVPAMDLNFGDGFGFSGVPRGQSARKEILVRNNGSAPLNLYSVEGTGEAFSTDPTRCIEKAINPGEACSIVVSFRPGDTLTHTGSVMIHSDSPGKPVTAISVTGFGSAPIASVHVEETGGRSMGFGKVGTGDAVTRRVRLTNIGKAPLLPGIPRLKGKGFSIAGDNCGGSTLKYAASCEVLVRFAPTRTSDLSGSLYLTTNDPEEGTVEVSLTGTGI